VVVTRKLEHLFHREKQKYFWLFSPGLGVEYFWVVLEMEMDGYIWMVLPE